MQQVVYLRHQLRLQYRHGEDKIETFSRKTDHKLQYITI